MEKSKVFVIIYFIIALLLSAYIHINAETFPAYLIMVLSNIFIFLALYFCIRGFQAGKIKFKILRVIGIIISVSLLFLLYFIASFYGFNSRDCYHLVAKNKFTGKVNIYCNFPPWYTKIIEGNEARMILLENCLKNIRTFSNNTFYVMYPDYCNRYNDSNKKFIYNPSTAKIILGYEVIQE